MKIFYLSVLILFNSCECKHNTIDLGNMSHCYIITKERGYDAYNYNIENGCITFYDPNICVLCGKPESLRKLSICGSYRVSY